MIKKGARKVRMIETDRWLTVVPHLNNIRSPTSDAERQNRRPFNVNGYTESIGADRRWRRCLHDLSCLCGPGEFKRI